jgi:hypothetical protein
LLKYFFLAENRAETAPGSTGKAAFMMFLGQWRVVRQLLVEALVICCTGAVLGVAASYLLARLPLLLSPASFPAESVIRINASVLAFSVALALLCGILIDYCVGSEQGPEYFAGDVFFIRCRLIKVAAGFSGWTASCHRQLGADLR